MFRKKYPGVYVDIYEGSGEEIQRQLQEGKIDFLFGTLPFQRNALQSIPITYEYLILGVPKEYAVNEELKRYQLSVNTVRQNLFLDEDIPAVPLLRFKDCPFIMLKKEGSDLYHRGLKICRNAGFTPQTHQFLDQIMTAYFVASSGMGVTFLRSSLLNLVEETGNLIYYKLEDELARRPIFLTRQEDRYMTKAMAAFLEIVRNLPPAYLK